MCPSMADSDSYISKPKKLSSEVTANHANPSKYFHQFLYKALLVTIFLVVAPLLPSQAPEFVNQNLHSRSWELLQLIFVGIAVSYGLFSKRNDESGKEHNHNSKFDNAQSYVTGLLQVSSVFDDETESTSVSDDNKIQTWNSQYHRRVPVVVVAKESPVLEKQNGTPSSRIDEKPLLLPVRSLKSRLPEPAEMETSQESSVKNGSNNQPNSNSGSKRFSNSSRKSRNGEFAGLTPLNIEENMEENVVLRSPIPWRSRSGRIEMKENEDGLPSYFLPSSFEESELKKVESRSIKSQSFRTSRPDSVCPSPNKPSPPPTSHSPKILSPLPTFSSESQAKSVEDVVRRKISVKSSPPPAPPPPPPPFIHKSPLLKSNSSLMHGDGFPEKELRRSVRSMPNDSSDTDREGLSRRTNSGPELRPRAQNDVSLMGMSVRTIRPNEPVMKSMKSREIDEDRNAREVEATLIEKRRFTDKLMHETAPSSRRQTSTKLPKAENKEYVENVLVETDESSDAESEDDYFEESVGSSANEVPANDNSTDEGPDVDKKADEFIAKFREQIRLQRIESIRRSTEQRLKIQSR